jgi:hypothetical protein
MRARNPRRPLWQREVRVGLGCKGNCVKQNHTEMIQLGRRCLQRVKVRRRGGYLTARMGFRHPHVPALSRHLLTAVPLGWSHRHSWQGTGHDRQCDEQYRQSENTDSTHEYQQGYCSGSCKFDATGGKRFRSTLVTQTGLRPSHGLPGTNSGGLRPGGQPRACPELVEGAAVPTHPQTRAASAMGAAALTTGSRISNAAPPSGRL